MSFEFLESLTAETVPQGLEIGSPDLDAMRELADAKDYSGLIGLAHSLAERQIFDIRVVVYGLYSEMRDTGLLGIRELLQTISVILKEKWSGIGPEDKRDRYAKSSLSWLFSSIRVDLQTVELEAGDPWKVWLETFSHQDLDDLLKRVGAIGHEIRAIIGEENAGDPSSKLTELSNWLGELSQKLPRRETSEENDTPEKEVDSGAKTGTGFLFSGGMVGGSVHLDILLQKLALFEQVIEQGDMAKASVVVADIMEIIENFDPKLYLPSIFSRFFSLMTPRIGEIYEMLEMRETPQFQSLQSLYKVDMEAFLNLEMNL